MKNLLSAFVIKSKEAGWYNEVNCFFNARLMLAFLLILNALTVLIIIFGRQKFFALVPFRKSEKIFWFVGALVVVVLVLKILYPKEKILGANLTRRQIASSFRNLIGYLIFTIVSLFLVIYLRP